MQFNQSIELSTSTFSGDIVILSSSDCEIILAVTHGVIQALARMKPLQENLSQTGRKHREIMHREFMQRAKM